jgi:hypothetical protein
MADADTSTGQGSPKKRKVKTPRCKLWSICDKPYFKDWRKDDFLLEFGMNEKEWDVFDAQVWPIIFPSLIEVEI